MDERVAKTKTSQEAKQLAENASRLGNADVAAQALEHAKTLQATEEGFTTPAQRAIATALYTYEDEQSRIKGRPFRANRTRRMLSEHGALLAAERMVLNRQPSKGFEVLEDAGLKSLSFEAIIDRHPSEFSELAVAAARARLTGGPRPPARRQGRPILSALAPQAASLPPKLDAEAQSFLEGFNDPTNWLRSRWLPRYRDVVGSITDALANNRPEDVFETLWKKADNDIALAGQGVLSFDTVDQMRQEFVQVIEDIYSDSSPSNFEAIVGKFERWKAENRISMVPRLLIARAFAGIHPQLYHTTVDATSQDRALQWFEEHTNFSTPNSKNWAARAQALVRHLDQLNVFNGDNAVRNIFPWFVVYQLRARTAQSEFRPGHTPRQGATDATITQAQRGIELRHNLVQTALYEQLSEEYGKDNVRTEMETGTGGFADAIAKPPGGGLHLYEIKIGKTAADVVRQAMGQLLEYGFREGGLEPIKLFVVGEPELDDLTTQFLARMRTEFNLNIDYKHVKIPDHLSPATL